MNRTLQALCAILGSACGGEDPEPPQGIPCEVQAVLEAKCHRCHGAVLKHEAPIHLLTLDQIHRVIDGTPVYARMRYALENDLMPATFIPDDPPVEPLTADEKATLLAWVTGGAKGVTNPQCP